MSLLTTGTPLVLCVSLTLCLSLLLSSTSGRLQVCSLTELAGTGLTGGNLEITTQPHQDTTNNTLGQHRGHKYQPRERRGIQTLSRTNKHQPGTSQPTGETSHTGEILEVLAAGTEHWDVTGCPAWGGHLVTNRVRRWWRWNRLSSSSSHKHQDVSTGKQIATK